MDEQVRKIKFAHERGMEQTKGRKMSATFKEEKQREVKENYKFFQSVLPELLKPHFGETFYEDGMFSILISCRAFGDNTRIPRCS